MNKPLYESYWQMDIAKRAFNMTESYFVQSLIDDPDLFVLLKRMKDDMQVISNSLQLYIHEDMKHGKDSLDTSA
jgi:hypothetical protein